MTLHQLHEAVFGRILKGLSMDRVEKHIEGFLKLLHFYRPACEELKAAQSRGEYTVILSGSPSFLVEPLAKFLKVDEWKSTMYGVDKDRVLCNIAILMEGTAKAQFLSEATKRLGINAEDVTAYSDSHTDLPLLMAVGKPVAVNPDRKLRKFAKLHKWSVI